ncbi:Glycosyltransferase DXD motif-containing protein, involved in Hassallidin biosynthesis [Planktothrix serta PCC 8927]|uniref:Glycosyltransferase DXD motif-containing protein, involved in Hassallidin biosynthesis n=1 Tax=Planktothrix serta PCC 8927 TaxID=671068 RepID=A0A1J1JQW1_9CYAN|nr:glycosyltransferase [Planktothrix serta]CZT62788.1 Glycosyltransferase DXD motif-containing protein, involved in Hassallidin biosynthesis [Planktothrix serta PCC 8927]VXD10557.1 Glycosyltransferase DXD motif-containing protein, involved in Hassallidin biosynthesis [Planktothrix serta PCC 8927]
MSQIPKIIHQIFFAGAAALPQKYLRYHQTVLQHHPDWEHQFWDESKSYQFMEQHYSWFLPVYNSYTYNIQRWDAIRYFILYHYGGFYIDIDIECLKPLNSLLGDFELVLSRLVGFSNAIMGSIPGHPLWLKVFEELPKRKDNSANKTMPYYIGYSTGPIMLNDCIIASQLQESPKILVCPGYIFEPGAPMELNGKIFKSLPNSQTYTIHHMTTSWLPPKHQIIRFLFGLVLEPYWFFGSLFKIS